MCVSVLYISRWEGGRLDMAVSASRARFRIQFLGLSCRLYFGPFCNRAISGSVKDMSVMFTTLGWKLLGLVGGVAVCCRLRRLSLLSRVWYIALHSFLSFSLIMWCMCGHTLPHDLPSQLSSSPTQRG